MSTWVKNWCSVVVQRYRPEGLIAQSALENLDSKLNSQTFRIDLDALTSEVPEGYDIEAAAELVKHELLSRL